MNEQTKPVLSIGMIFKNEARCLERCLKSLAPLREAIPCELVMADTGSTDGSREVAERYADILFDFPWIDDFAAARNAVLDRCSGGWCLMVDADEWLDGDVSELVSFLGAWRGERTVVGTLVQRNYTTYDPDGPYMDFYAGRLACLAENPRYTGPIHEVWDWPGKKSKHAILRRTVLHHDGYVAVNQGGEAGRAKRARNVKLLREAVEREPDNLIRHLQLIESGQGEPDFLKILRRAVRLTEERKLCWEMVGPPILRYAVAFAAIQGLPEEAEWIRKAEEWFPESAFTRIDVAFSAFSFFLREGELEQAALRGEGYLKALEEDRAGSLDPAARMRSALQMDAPLKEQALKISLADVYRKLDRAEDALKLLEGLDPAILEADTAGKLARVLMNLQLNTRLDTAPAVRSLWEGLSAPVPSRAKAEERKRAFRGVVLPAFSRKNLDREREYTDFFRHTYTLFLPLAGKCGLGTAAAMLESAGPRELERLLGTVEDWRELPGAALAHAIRRGVRFPLPDRPLKLEEMDVLASRLARDGEVLALLSSMKADQDIQELCWRRALALAAVRVWPWPDKEQDAEEGMAVARAFAQVEGRFLPLCYAADVLREDRLFLLPPLHRFGWYCARAFAALDDGDRAGYVRLLREGLAVCESAKPMAEFLLKHTPQLQEPKPSAELLALAEKVRTLLSAYAPDAPAVTALKQSPAYQKVAHLIEGIDGGGLPS